MENQQSESKRYVSFNDFICIQMCVGCIRECHMMEGSAKLYHLCVDIGEEKLRNVLAGIKEFFSPEELVGQKVIIVSNLEPKKMRGIVSEGMILMTDTEEGKPVFVVPEENVPLGSLLR